MIGWAYLLGSLLGLVQDKGFQAALVAARFAPRGPAPARAVLPALRARRDRARWWPARSTAWGSASSRSTPTRRGCSSSTSATSRPTRRRSPPTSTSPEILALAGLAKRECIGVLALTPDDRDNLAVAVAARLLHPGLRTIARAHTPEAMEAMATCGVDEIINPYREFAERLAIAHARARHPPAARMADRAARQPPARLGFRRRPGAGSSAATAGSARRWRGRSATAAST